MGNNEASRNSDAVGSDSSFGLPFSASISVSIILETKYTVVEKLGYKSVARIGGVTTAAVVGVVAVVDAIKRGGPRSLNR